MADLLIKDKKISKCKAIIIYYKIICEYYMTTKISEKWNILNPQKFNNYKEINLEKI